MKLLSIILALILTLGGCTYYVEVNDKSYVIALGLDKAENGLLKFSFLFTSPKAGEGESGGGEQPNEKDIVTVEAPTVYSALRLLNTFEGKQIDVAHTKLIVFSEELAKKGIASYVNDFVNTRGFRPSIYLCVSLSGAEKFLNGIAPKQELFLERYIDRLFGKITNADVNDAYLYYNYFSALRGGGSLLPLVGISEKKEDVETAETDFADTIPDDFSINYLPDGLPKSEKISAAWCGYAAFDCEKMIGTLGRFEGDLAKLAGKNLPDRNLSVYFPAKDSYVTVLLRQLSRPKINVRCAEIPEIDITIPLYGEYTGIEDALKTKSDYLEFEKYLNTALSDKLEELFLRSQTEFGCDLLALGDNAKKCFLTNRDWEDYRWSEKYTSAKINASVEVNLNDFGELRFSPKEG